MTRRYRFLGFPGSPGFPAYRADSAHHARHALGLAATCLVGFAITLVAAAGCHDDDAGETAATTAPIEPAKDAITKTTEVGPVKATIKVWPAKPALGDAIYARLEIDAPAGVTIEAPFQEAGDQRLGRFGVVAFTRDTRRKPDGGQVHEQTYTLEAPSSGRQRIPPLRFEMTDTRKGTASDVKQPQEVLTDEVPLEITPVAAEAASAKLRPAAGELDPDVGGIGWLALLGIASGLAVVGSGSVLAYRALRARRRIEQQRSAYDEAVAQLRTLEDRGPPDDTTADGWFVQLSSIVRRYLELRYEIRAPELTTEEFLQVATARPELHAEHRALLTSFLERCDRVKFAGYRPDADESLATLKAARGFVEDTRLREPIAVAVARPSGPHGPGSTNRKAA
jgi:preprotein translocase subunit Sss1